MGRVLISADFEDGGASGGLARLGSAFEHLERRSANGAQGLRSVEVGLRMLAAESVGLTGPLGRVAEGLLALGAGSTAVLAVAAGLAIVSKAYAALTSEARESAKAVKENRQALDDAAKHEISSPAGARLGLLATSQQNLGRGEAELARLRNLQQVGLGGPDIAQRIADQAYENLLTRIKMRQARGGPVMFAATDAESDPVVFRGDAASTGRAAARLGIRPNPRFAEFGSSGLRSNISGGVGELGDEARKILDGLRTPVEILQQRMVTLKGAFDAGELSQSQYEDGVKRLGDAMDAASKKSTQLAVSIIGAVSGSIAALMSGGKPGSILSGLGGILSLVPGMQIPGAVISGIGSIISAGDGASHVVVDSYSDTAVGQQRAIMQALAGYFGLSIDVLSAGAATPDQTAYALGRAARTDGVMRLPPGSAVR